MTRTMTGGCQCGSVRYAVAIENDDAVLCHCRMCQRATGGVSAAYKNVAIANLEWTTRSPDYYRSSPIARRGFCKDCGTPLTFEFIEPDATMDVTVGSFDDPYGFRPTISYACEAWHADWLDTGGLDAMRSDENASVRDRWMKPVGKRSD